MIDLQNSITVWGRTPETLEGGVPVPGLWLCTPCNSVGRWLSDGFRIVISMHTASSEVLGGATPGKKKDSFGQHGA